MLICLSNCYHKRSINAYQWPTTKINQHYQTEALCLELTWEFWCDGKYQSGFCKSELLGPFLKPQIAELTVLSFKNISSGYCEEWFARIPEHDALSRGKEQPGFSFCFCLANTAKKVSSIFIQASSFNILKRHGKTEGYRIKLGLVRSTTTHVQSACAQSW